MDYQQIIIVGNVGREPEQLRFESGTTATKISVGVKPRRDDETLWFEVMCWDKLGQTALRAQRGERVLVVGTLAARSYLDKTGEPRFALSINAREFRFLGRGSGVGDQAASIDAPF